MAIIDEAHRLRNFRQAGNKTTEALSAAFKDCKRYFTATQIIGNIIDLWGLITFIDKDTFINAEDYPIYDSFADKVLRYFRKADGFYKFENI